MSVADDLAQRLEAAREKFHAVRDFVGPGDSPVQAGGDPDV